jgi:cyclopropane fatty-acyl-phospholipid synthase-like methyltransferase
MSYSDFFSKQARKPTGIFGRFYMSRIFNRGNMELSTLLYEMLSIEEDDQLLEIGFGTGALVKKIAKGLTRGSIEGVDFSRPMVELSKKKNRKYIKEGRARLYWGNFSCVFTTLNSER